MSIENNNSHEELSSPFIIEKIEEVSVPNCEVKDRKLFINGVVSDKYNNVQDKVVRQNNDSDLIHFRHYESEEDDSYIDSIVNVNEPDKDLLTVIKKADKNNHSYEDRDTIVNGVKWDSLKGLDTFYNVHRVEVDPDGKKIVFCGNEKDRVANVIVNNQKWKNKFEHVSVASSVGGIVYALGSINSHSNKLVINDVEWTYNQFKDERYSNSVDRISDVKLDKNGIVVAIIDSTRSKEFRRYISIGDKVSEKQVWKNSFETTNYKDPNLIAIDDKSGIVAVFGKENKEGETKLVINDIPYEIPTNPQKLELMNFKDGSLIIQYIDALGEKISEKITLKEDSKVMQEMKEKKEAEEKVFNDLRRLLIQEGISAGEIVKRLKKGDDLDKEIEKNTDLNSRYNDQRNKNNELELGYRKLQEANQEQKSKDESKIKTLEVNSAITQREIASIETILKGAGKSAFGSDLKISKKDMEIAFNSIEEIKSLRETK